MNFRYNEETARRISRIAKKEALLIKGRDTGVSAMKPGAGYTLEQLLAHLRANRKEWVVLNDLPLREAVHYYIVAQEAYEARKVQ